MSEGYNNDEGSDEETRQQNPFSDHLTPSYLELAIQLRNTIIVPEGCRENPPHPVDSDVSIYPEQNNGQGFDNLASAVGLVTESKEKTIDDTSDPGGNHLMTRNEIKVHIMLQLSSQAPAIKHTVILSTNVLVLQLKKSQEHTLEVPHECQRWLFKNIELNNNDTLGGSNVRTSDYIHVLQIEKQDHTALL